MLSKNFLLVLILTLLAFSGFSQNPNYGWTNSVGNGGMDFAYGSDIDEDGNTYITGYYTGTVDFDPSTAVYYLTSGGTSDIFVAKYSPSGALVWVKGFTGSGSNQSYGRGIRVDKIGNLFVTGTLNGVADFDPSSSTFNLNSSNGNLFVVKLNQNTGSMVWAGQIKTNAPVIDNEQIEVDDSNNFYIANRHTGTTNFSFLSGTSNLTATTDNFLAKYSNNGTLIWVEDVGGGDIQNLEIDANYNIIYSGNFMGNTDFDPSSTATYMLYNTGTNYDGMIIKLDASGQFVFAKQIANTTTSLNIINISDLKIDADGNIVFIGDFTLTTIDVDPGSALYAMTNAGGGEDILLEKLDSYGNFIWAKQISSTGVEFGYSIVTDKSNNIYINGLISGANCDFDPSSATYYLSPTSGSVYNAFIARYDKNGAFNWAINYAGEFWPTNSLLLDENDGSVYDMGFYNGIVDFDPSSGTDIRVSNDSWDICLHKMKQDPVRLEVDCFIEGYYIGSATMQPVLYNEGILTTLTPETDEITVELHEASPPYSIVPYGTNNAILSTSGTCNVGFNPGILPDYYYIVVKHRDVIQTWSSSPVLIQANSSNMYDFTSAKTQAYGNNMVEVSTGVWAFFSGDINQDENIDILDLTILYNDISTFTSGYFPSDINGDGNTDINDDPILSNNLSNFIYSIHP
jgi:hypothetical protein